MTRSVDDVVDDLDEVVTRAVREQDRIGCFAALYRTVTVEVRDGIADGFFDDGERMARLDVVFADRFLDALATHRAGGRPTRSWAAAFDAARSSRPIVLQHLLLGINAHINLDLGIASATVAPGADLPGLRRDFDRINEVLASLLGRVRRELAVVSPWLGMLDTFGGRTDDEVVRFSIEVARAEAWRFAGELAPLERDHWGGPIGVRDARVARLARTVLRPGPLSMVVALVRLREEKDVRRVIATLSGVRAPSRDTVEERVTDERAPDR